MRVIILTLMLTAGSLTALAGGNEKFIKAVKAGLEQMDSAKTIGDWLAVANKFERIAGAEKKEWLAYYYASQSYVIMSYMDEDRSKLDTYLDKAQELIDNARKASKKNAEIHVLQSWIYSARIGADPMTRGPKFGGMSSMELNTAEEYDADNPRIYYMRATSLYYTPAQWGGGKDKALPILETAMAKYEAFKPESEIHPDWGKEQTATMLADCKKELGKD